jgi:hypothetical protein
MGKASAGKRDVIHRQQIAARRAAARRAQMRNRMLLAGGAIIAVVAVAPALVLVKANSKPAAAAPPANGPAGTALARVVNDLTSIQAPPKARLRPDPGPWHGRLTLLARARPGLRDAPAAWLPGR